MLGNEHEEPGAILTGPPSLACCQLPEPASVCVRAFSEAPGAPLPLIGRLPFPVSLPHSAAGVLHTFQVH